MQTSAGTDLWSVCCCKSVLHKLANLQISILASVVLLQVIQPYFSSKEKTHSKAKKKKYFNTFFFLSPSEIAKWKHGCVMFRWDVWGLIWRLRILMHVVLCCHHSTSLYHGKCSLYAPLLMKALYAPLLMKSMACCSITSC